MASPDRALYGLGAMADDVYVSWFDGCRWCCQVDERWKWCDAGAEADEVLIAAGRGGIRKTELPG